MFSSLDTWSCITIIVGVVELTAGFSLFTGAPYGRVIGIIAAGIGANDPAAHSRLRRQLGGRVSRADHANSSLSCATHSEWI